MPVVRVSELRKMKPEDLEDKLTELRMELARLRAAQALGGTPENPSRIRDLRKAIARTMTVQHESELSGTVESEDEAKEK